VKESIETVKTRCNWFFYAFIFEEIER
jgi:hypothetical protein